MLKAAGIIKENVKDFSQPQNELAKCQNVDMHRTRSFEINATVWHSMQYHCIWELTL